MNNLNFYTYFRRELDKTCIPMILDIVDTKPIMYRGRQVGILCTKNNCIDCVYVMPTLRRKGLAKKAVMEWLKATGYTSVDLLIINSNGIALKFWSKIFKLTPISTGEIDTLYRGELYGNT